MMTWAGYDDNSNIELKLGGEVKNVWANTVSIFKMIVKITGMRCRKM